MTGRLAELFDAGPARLWSYLVALLGAPTLWTLHLLVCYFLVALACTTAWGEGVDWLIIAATLVLAAGSAWCGLYAWRRWREHRGGLAADLNGPPSAAAFLYLMGALGSVLFTVAVLWEGLPPLFVPTCQLGSP